MWMFIISLCCCLAYVNGDELGVRTYSFDRGFDVYRKKLGIGNFINPNDGDSLYYALCTEVSKEMLCTMTRLTYIYENQTISQICKNIKVDNLLIDQKLPNKFRFYYKSLWNLLDINTCNVTTLEFDDKNKIALFHNTWDIFSVSKERCGIEGGCRITYDYNGLQIGKPSPFALEVFYLPNSVDPSSPDKGYFLTMPDSNNSAILTYSNRAGEIKSGVNFYDLEVLDKIKISNDLAGWCMFDRNVKRVICKQVGIKGVTLNRILEFDCKFESNCEMAVYNLGEGEILLAALNEIRKGRKLGWTSVQWRYVREGNYSQPDRWLDVNNLDLECDEGRLAADLQISEVEDDYCLTVACRYSTDNWIQMKYRKQCVSKKYIKQLSGLFTENSKL